MSDKNDDESMLARVMAKFQMRLSMHRMRIPLKPRPHPVSDEEYQKALDTPDSASGDV